MDIFKNLEDINSYIKLLDGLAMQHSTSRQRNSTSNKLFKAIDILIDSKIKELKFNWTETGVIKKDNNDGSYEVSYGVPEYVSEESDDQGSFIEKTKTLPAITGMKYEIGDVVYIEVVNNDYSFKYIKCKRPKGL